jgi:hypothetical protein
LDTDAPLITGDEPLFSTETTSLLSQGSRYPSAWYQRSTSLYSSHDFHIPSVVRSQSKIKYNISINKITIMEVRKSTGKN